MVVVRERESSLWLFITLAYQLRFRWHKKWWFSWFVIAKWTRKFLIQPNSQIVCEAGSAHNRVTCLKFLKCWLILSDSSNSIARENPCTAAYQQMKNWRISAVAYTWLDVSKISVRRVSSQTSGSRYQSWFHRASITSNHHIPQSLPANTGLPLYFPFHTWLSQAVVGWNLSLWSGRTSS